MANLSDKTRKQQVLIYLQTHRGQWVDGPTLATESIGGSEGLKRLRELRLEGYAIETRKHPDPARDIWQYRLVEGAPVADSRPRVPDRPVDARPKREPLKFTTKPARLAFGEAIPCPLCDGRKISIDPITKKRGECTRCNGFGIVPVPHA